MAQVAEIVNVIAPINAPPGEQVIVDVRVKNVGYSSRSVSVTGSTDTVSLQWQFDYLTLLPGETVVFRGWFTMPAENVRVNIWSWYWDETQWIYDDTAFVDMALSAISPVFNEFRITDYRVV